MDLHEPHRAAVAKEDREHHRPQMLALERAGGRCLGRDRRRAAPPGHPEPVDDVVGFDAGPHDDAQLRELGAHRAELFSERALAGVEIAGPAEQRIALGQVRATFLGTVRDLAVTGGVPDGAHRRAPRSTDRSGGSAK
jgi:hypothetical protein